jgi:hypothetical protein
MLFPQGMFTGWVGIRPKLTFQRIAVFCDQKLVSSTRNVGWDKPLLCDQNVSSTKMLTGWVRISPKLSSVAVLCDQKLVSSTRNVDRVGCRD